MITYKTWHNLLDMEKHDQAWHEQDIIDELNELKEATGLIDKWSEMSDVVYTVTRARWSGHKLKFPIQKQKVLIGSLYMFPKYTSRWVFFYTAGKKAGANRKVTEVRNPAKLHKLHHIASKYNIDSDIFASICEQQTRYWPLLK